jgi:hypothetical protein
VNSPEIENAHLGVFLPLTVLFIDTVTCHLNGNQQQPTTFICTHPNGPRPCLKTEVVVPIEFCQGGGALAASLTVVS